MADKSIPKKVSSTDDAKKQKQQRKMTRLLGKAWTFPDADFLHAAQSSHGSSSSGPADLTTIGKALDDGGYQQGRAGWEKFATHLGGVYNSYVCNRNNKHSAIAKKALDHVLELLGKVDKNYATVASKASPAFSPYSDFQGSSAIPKKRKQNEMTMINTHVPKKRTISNDIPSKKSLTLSQREEKAMEALESYIVECGGDRQQVINFHVKITNKGIRNREDDIAYYSPQGVRYTKKSHVAKFLGLDTNSKLTDGRRSSSSAKKSSIKSGKPRNLRESENERKKLKKEIDKLLKAHAKASKSLEDFRGDHSSSKYPIDDDIVMKEESENLPLCAIARSPDINGYPGFPTRCIPELLMVWDFLCTFHRVLSLEPICFDEFVSAIMFLPSCTRNSVSQDMAIPVFLSECHLALLKLLLNDKSSDDWWYSTLETETVKKEDEPQDIDATSGETIGDNPTIKIDMAALLTYEEDPVLTTRWLQALDQARPRKTSVGGPIKRAVKSAFSITTNHLVKAYLRKSMREWKEYSAASTKKAVIWLADKVREARPDLRGRKVSQVDVDEQRSKVIREVSSLMDSIEDDSDVTYENGSHFDGLSEEESEEDDDDNDEDYVCGEKEVDNSLDSKQGKLSSKQKKILDQNDDTTQVTSSIPKKPPPTEIDLLLPPAKPQFNSDIVTPLTWPCIVGAACSRILHRYKRKRNEVDDDLRDFHLRPLLSVKGRLDRENNITQRMFSECAAILNVGEEKIFPMESSIAHLCSGKLYFDLSPVQRLCILRLLIEAAYDTSKVAKVVEENFRARLNAVKSLENEEKRAKREAREESVAADQSARKRLAEEARSSFILKKRHAIKRKNNATNEYTSEFIENLTDNDVIEFDEETKSEYDKLPSPLNFNKTEVNAMKVKINEETAFESNSVLVLSMDEIQSREEEALEQLEKTLASYGDTNSTNGNHTVEGEISAKLDKLRRDIDNMKSSILNLPPARKSAIETLTDAIEAGTGKELRSAIKAAKIAQLFGIEESTGGVWTLDILRDAVLELKDTDRRRRVTEAQKELVAKRNKCFVRTEPLGQDRFRNSVWKFDHDDGSRLWAEDFDFDFNSDCNRKGSDVVGACFMDEEDDFLIRSPSPNVLEKIKLFSRKEYHRSGNLPNPPQKHWGLYMTDKSLRSIMKSCDQRGVRESGLKSCLKDFIESKWQSCPDDTSSIEEKTVGERTEDQKTSKHSLCKADGDEDNFSQAKCLAKSKGVDTKLIESTTSALSQRIRIRQVLDNTNEGIARYDMGTVIGWIMVNTPSPTDKTDEDRGEEDKMETIKSTSSPLWRVVLDKGDEIDISSLEVVTGLIRAIQWTNNHDGYSEPDSSFLLFRNNLGRFCGRQMDAPFSASPFFFAKHMVKREAELYSSLKNRSYKNDWGGKSNARNSWISSMKQNDLTFAAVREGLKTLENAFFDLSGGFQGKSNDPERSSAPLPNGKELLHNESYRFDIELESIIEPFDSLWNSPETRAIFLEIIESSTSVPVLGLGLDLMCRNCETYLRATKSMTSYSHEPPRSTRRQNAWQQQHHY